MIDNQMASLPTDILDQLMYNYPDSLALTCQHYYHFVTMTRKIQRWYRSWRLLPEKYFPEKLTKKTMIRYYIMYYPHKYFLKYPEFMCRKMNDPLHYQVLQTLPSLQDRKISDVLSFLRHPSVSCFDISYTGW